MEIPKKDRSKRVSNYHPTSLVINVYKTIAKVLSICLSAVLDDTISPNQRSFVGGRQILDDVSLVANKSVKYMQRAKKEGLVLKLDLKRCITGLIGVSWI